MAWYQVSYHGFVGAIRTNEEEIIQETAPQLRRFKGQPLGHLCRWLASLYKPAELVYVDMSAGHLEEPSAKAAVGTQSSE